MKKPLVLVFIILAMALVACQAQATPSTTAAPADTPTQPPAVSPEAERPTAAANPAVTEMVGPQAPPGCTVVSQANNSAEDSPFPQISDEDWVQGPEDAYVSIIEYGDFQ